MNILWDGKEKSACIDWLIDLGRVFPDLDEKLLQSRENDLRFMIKKMLFCWFNKCRFFYRVQIQHFGENSETNWWIIYHRYKLSASTSYCKYFCVFYCFYTLFIKSVKKYKRWTKLSLFLQTIFSSVARSPIFF